MIDNQKELFYNQLDVQWKLWLPATVVFVLGCKGVLGVDERNSIPTWHRDGFVDAGFNVGCNDKFLRFFVLAGDDE
jgi:hypothetical protein